jgi:hypothetical protein
MEDEKEAFVSNQFQEEIDFLFLEEISIRYELPQNKKRTCPQLFRNNDDSIIKGLYYSFANSA